MKKYSVYLMGFLYVLAGANHFINPAFYLKMLDGFLPYGDLLNVMSGGAEIILGIAVCFLRTRKLAAYGIILLLIAVFPANIYMAVHHEAWNLSALGLYLRLPVQFLLIWWAYIYTKP